MLKLPGCILLILFEWCYSGLRRQAFYGFRYNLKTFRITNSDHVQHTIWKTNKSLSALTLWYENLNRNNSVLYHNSTCMLCYQYITLHFLHMGYLKEKPYTAFRQKVRYFYTEIYKLIALRFKETQTNLFSIIHFIMFKTR